MKKIKACIFFFLSGPYRAKTIIRIYLYYTKIYQKKNFFGGAGIAWIFFSYLFEKFHVDISFEAKIGEDLKLPHPMNIVIGRGCTLGKKCTIYHGVTLGQNKDKFPRIGDNVIIYMGAKIVGDVVVGNNAIIGANAVVVKDVLENQIVAGVPAKCIGWRKENDEFY